MRSAGIIQTLIRERHPFAVLAILAFLMPGLLSAGGVAGAFSSFRLADGTTVICTGSGFARVADPASAPDTRPGHEKTNCCATGCVHAGGIGLAALAVAQDGLPLDFGAPMRPHAAASNIAAAPDAPGAIRAPPARSV
ncbi:hypothetical protein [Microbaculum marinum]|uniref:DUF2946 domain-containing protein n=1 Tax=Microbaculum marinum TaxID=1764581 RepID=A0AAW9RUW3_9HYPH